LFGTGNSPELGRLFRPGDWLVAATALTAVAASFPLAWSGGTADHAIVRSAGRVIAELPLSRDRTLTVPGPLGASVVAVSGGKARIESDPGPRQYCVRQGWLQNAGDIAVCLPNQLSVELAGRTRRYDSLSY
jgi:hypothetical protein